MTNTPDTSPEAVERYNPIAVAPHDEDPFGAMETDPEGGFVLYEDYAAMLRACKGQVSVDGLAQIIRTVDGSNSLGAGALAEAILAALEPAPDHSEWNAAIEAAAAVANYESQDAEYDPSYQTAAEVIEYRIRALKKGQSNE